MRRFLFALFVCFPLLFFFAAWPEIRLRVVTKAIRQTARYDLGYRFTFERARLFSSGEIEYEGVKLVPLTANSFGELTLEKLKVTPSIRLTKREVEASIVGERGVLKLSAAPYAYTPPRQGRRGLFKSILSLRLKGVVGHHPFKAELLPSGEGALTIGNELVATSRGEIAFNHFPLELLGEESPFHIREGEVSGSLRQGEGELSFQKGSSWSGRLSLLPEKQLHFFIDQLGSLTLYPQGEKMRGEFSLAFGQAKLSGALLAEEREGGYAVALQSKSASFEKGDASICGELYLKLLVSSQFEKLQLSGEIRGADFRLPHGAEGKLSSTFFLDEGKLTLSEVAGESGALYFVSRGEVDFTPLRLSLFDFSYAEGPIPHPLLPGALTGLLEGSHIDWSEESVSGHLIGNAALFLGEKVISYRFDLEEEKLKIEDLHGEWGALEVASSQFLTLDRGIGHFDFTIGAAGEDTIHLFGPAEIKEEALSFSFAEGAHVGSFEVAEGGGCYLKGDLEGALSLRGDLRALAGDLAHLHVPYSVPELEGEMSLTLLREKGVSELALTLREPRIGALKAPSALFKGRLNDGALTVDLIRWGGLSLSLELLQGEEFAIKNLRLSYPPFAELKASGNLYPHFALFEGKVEEAVLTPLSPLHFRADSGTVRLQLGSREPLSFALPLTCEENKALSLLLSGRGSLRNLKSEVKLEEASFQCALLDEKLKFSNFHFEKATPFSGLKEIELDPSGRFVIEFALSSPQLTPFGSGKIKGHFQDEGALLDELVEMQDGFYLSRVHLGSDPSLLSYSGELSLHLLLETAGKKTKVDVGGSVWEPEILLPKR